MLHGEYGEMRFINEYRYDIDDTRTVMKAYYLFFNKVKLLHLLMLVLCAVSTGLYISSGLKRFLVIAIIFLLMFLFRFVQYFVGTKYDAKRIQEETGEASPVYRYEIDNSIEIYRAGKLHASLPMESIAGCKEMNGCLVIFMMGGYSALLKNDSYLEGGATALKAYLREHGVAVK